MGTTASKVATKQYHEAVRTNKAKLVKELLEDTDVTINVDGIIKDGTGNTALHLASREGYVEIIRCLLAKEAYCLAINKAGETPLHIAARSGHARAVFYLLKYALSGKNASSISRIMIGWEQHPLTESRRRRHKLVPEQRPLAMAKIKGETEIVKLLEAADILCSFHGGQSYDVPPKKLDINQAHTILLDAARKHHSYVAEYTFFNLEVLQDGNGVHELMAKLDVNYQTAEGRQLLDPIEQTLICTRFIQAAKFRDEVEDIELLIQENRDVLTNDKSYVFSLAIEAAEGVGHSEIEDYLRKMQVELYGPSERRRRLIVRPPVPPLVGDEKLTVSEAPALAEGSQIVSVLFFVFLALTALFIGYLFFRCFKARKNNKPKAKLVFDIEAQMTVPSTKC